MNGQRERQRLVRELLAGFSPQLVIESGSYRGDTSGFLADIADCDVISIEAVARFHHFARRRYAGRNDIELRLGDSPAVLRDLAERPDATEGVFFYLDAHWHDHLPLLDELAVIDERYTNSIVLIDDTEVADDAGYAFDHAPDGRRLDDALLDESAASSWPRFVPAVPSDVETGWRRGCALLLQPGAVEPGSATAEALERSWRQTRPRP